MKATTKERVQVWNTLLSFARREAVSIARAVNPGWTDTLAKSTLFELERLPKDVLPRLSLLVWLILSVEARANHLIEERIDNGVLLARAAQGTLTKNNFMQKWGFLGGSVQKGISFDKKPHSCVKELSNLRDNLLHSNFDWVKTMPSEREFLRLFNEWVEAMEDMNVRLERPRGRTPLPEVLSLQVRP